MSDTRTFTIHSVKLTTCSYLNLNCESEGLYRVPGSGPQVKHWQRRFDSEGDVDLLDEHELYDPNNISSMLKSWLRDLPTEIMPKTLQHELAEELAKDNPDYQKIGQPAPQKLLDALSNLPPFNYYLLFAITCHLSLLLSHRDKNKMDLNNLSICIGPCLDLERWLFNYLVGDWRNCWQGCYTEKQYLAAEKAYERGLEHEVPVAQGQHDRAESRSRKMATNERAIHSRSSGRSPSRDASRQGSHYEDARSAQQSPHRGNENVRPDNITVPSYSQFSNGSVTTLERKNLASQEPQRPATAGKQTSDSSKTSTPRQGSHSRSQSDFQLSPVKPTSPVDFPFPSRN